MFGYATTPRGILNPPIMGETAFVGRRFEGGVRRVTKRADHFCTRADLYLARGLAGGAGDDGNVAGGLVGSP